MTVDEIQTLLFQAARCVVPRTDLNVGKAERIAALEDYLLDSANWRGQLEECRLYASEALKNLKKDWSHLQGWEMYRDSKDKTVAGVQDAKRQCDPGLYDSIKDGEWLVSSLSDQIRRFEQDYEAVSRTYTFATGG